MKIHFLSFIVLLTLIGCKNDNNNSEHNYAYLGGQIINPNNDFVVLSKNDMVIDTIKLDNKNRFLYKITNLDEGLYTFYHGGEIQMVLLEPKDSLIFRLNTLEFDESLVFTGLGDKKNNYLINEFLENELQEKKIFKFCQLKPHVYQRRIDSLKQLKTERLNEFKIKYNTSELFNRIAQGNINYGYYSSKEVYPFVHFGTNKAAILKSLPSNFYDYRKDINYNDKFLKDYQYYNSFLRYSVNNLALKNHLHHSNEDSFSWNSICYNLDRLNLVDSLISSAVLKDDLLYHFTSNYLSKSSNTENNNVLLNSFLSKSKDDVAKDKMKRFALSLNNLKVGSAFPSTIIVDTNDSELDINSLLKSPTVICFWSHSYIEHFKEIHYKISELKIKYPEVKFIIINTDNNNQKHFKTALKENRFDFKDEYQFKTPLESVEALAIQPITKTIIIDKNQKIVNSNSNLFSIKFEEQLLGAINR
ncbi:TlpA family protein disulfide reductase [Mariniflexile aquimaris]|uniref:TlpA family protein disulfide reductase n=1 Tax=Mariniflexile aquimaris TaxID=881009 RepID=A0ABW3BT59_9FLAO